MSIMGENGLKNKPKKKLTAFTYSGRQDKGFFLILMLLFCLQDFFLMMCAYIYSLKHLLKTEGTFSESYRILLLIGRLYGILTAQVLLLK